MKSKERVNQMQTRHPYHESYENSGKHFQIRNWL